MTDQERELNGRLFMPTENLSLSARQGNKTTKLSLSARQGNKTKKLFGGQPKANGLMETAKTVDEKGREEPMNAHFPSLET